jgi:hypothetical protein
MDLDAGTTSLQIAGGDVSIATVVPRPGQHHYPLAVSGAVAGRGEGHGVPGAIHRLVEVAGVGLVDPLVLLGGKDRLHLDEATYA